MGANFKESRQLNGKFKYLAVENGIFVDVETGEQIQVADILESIYGTGEPFDLTTSKKSEYEVEPDEIPDRSVRGNGGENID